MFYFYLNGILSYSRAKLRFFMHIAKTFIYKIDGHQFFFG